MSPVLFMLYTEPLYRMGCPERRFGYADDIALTRIGGSIEETTRLIAADLVEILGWGRENAIAFDEKKSELQHFTRSHKQEHLSVEVDSHSVKPKKSKEVVQ